jgi:hypothetical protein
MKRQAPRARTAVRNPEWISPELGEIRKVRIPQWLPLALCLAIVGSSLAVNPLRAASLDLPDLGMARLRGFTVETTPTGQTRLRFTTIIVNVGDGPFQVYGHDKQNGEFAVDQQIRDSDGSWTTLPTAYHMYFAGDGHNHWHVRDLESYELQNTAATIKRTGEKHGFCFFDNYQFDLGLPGAPQSVIYAKGSCGKPTSISVTTGLSIGWGDRYSRNLADQYIDISGLPSGEYTLTATADALGFFSEACETNNTTTTLLRITGGTVKVLQHGVDSQPCS